MYFEITKGLLDKYLMNVCLNRGITHDEGLRAIVQYLRNMSEEWYSGQQPTISYEDPFCRFAYLYAHVPANANTCEVAIQAHLNDFLTRKFRENTEVKVCAFGGGLGMEYLAFAKYLASNLPDERPVYVKMTLIDRTREWFESFQAMDASVSNKFKQEYGEPGNWPCVFSASFVPLDMTNLRDFGNLPDIFSQDVFILNYVISEVVSGRDKLLEVLRSMVEGSPRDARFLFIDRDERDEEAVRNSVEEMASDANLRIRNMHSSNRNMDTDEQIADVEPYPSQLGRSPRVQWRAFHSLAIKD